MSVASEALKKPGFILEMLLCDKSRTLMFEWSKERPRIKGGMHGSENSF